MKRFKVYAFPKDADGPQLLGPYGTMPSVLASGPDTAISAAKELVHLMEVQGMLCCWQVVETSGPEEERLLSSTGCQRDDQHTIKESDRLIPCVR